LLGHFHATVTPKMQSQKCNFTILQLQDFLVNYELHEMLISFGFYIQIFISIRSQNFIFFGIKEPTKWSPFIACHNIKNTQMQ
jgi:DNA-binding transcriptional regulator LsrR (DeoR family)